MTIQQLRNKLEQRKGQKIQLEKNLSTVRKEIRDTISDLHRHEEAREIIRIVGLETQKTLQFHISDITSLALEAVFPNPYELSVEFVQRRNKTECDLLFERDGMKVEPLEAAGVGAVDVASFALRIASWSMRQPRTRNVIVLDEPFKFLSVDLQERASDMLKTIAQKLGVQFIIVTHEQVLAASANKTFETKIRKGRTKIVTS
jgi:hypothetical protein